MTSTLPDLERVLIGEFLLEGLFRRLPGFNGSDHGACAGLCHQLSAGK